MKLIYRKIFHKLRCFVQYSVFKNGYRSCWVRVFCLRLIIVLPQTDYQMYVGTQIRTENPFPLIPIDPIAMWYQAISCRIWSIPFICLYLYASGIVPLQKSYKIEKYRHYSWLQILFRTHLLWCKCILTSHY